MENAIETLTFFRWDFGLTLLKYSILILLFSQTDETLVCHGNVSSMFSTSDIESITDLILQASEDIDYCFMKTSSYWPVRVTWRTPSAARLAIVILRKSRARRIVGYLADIAPEIGLALCWRGLTSGRRILQTIKITKCTDYICLPALWGIGTCGAARYNAFTSRIRLYTSLSLRCVCFMRACTLETDNFVSIGATNVLRTTPFVDFQLERHQLSRILFWTDICSNILYVFGVFLSDAVMRWI